MRFEISFKSLYQHLIARWTLLVGVGLAGAVVASLVIFLAPNTFRAQAVVMVDQQVELAVPPSSALDDVLYISRETVRLEELSYSDSLWEEVFARIDIPEFESRLASAGDLREWVGVPHSQDGAWYFTAEHSDPAFASALANAWAESFVVTVQGWIDTAQQEHALLAQIEELAGLQVATTDECVQIEWTAIRVAEIQQTTLSQSGIPQNEINEAVSRIRQLIFNVSLAPRTYSSIISLEEAIQYSQGVVVALEEEALACRARMDSLQLDLDDLEQQLAAIVESSHGVSPYLRIQFSQSASEPAKPTVEIGNAALSGFIIAVVLWIMADVLSFSESTSRRDRADV